MYQLPKGQFHKAKNCYEFLNQMNKQVSSKMRKGVDS